MFGITTYKWKIFHSNFVANWGFFFSFGYEAGLYTVVVFFFFNRKIKDANYMLLLILSECW